MMMNTIIKPATTSFSKATHPAKGCMPKTTRVSVVATAPGRAQLPGQRAPGLAPRASVTTAATLPSLWSDDKRKAALLKLARVHNLVPSVLLVFLGAWVSRR